MKIKLTATLTHKDFDKPLIKTIFYEGGSIDDILNQIKTPHQHHHNLKHYRKTAFIDAHGVKHTWKLEDISEPRPAA